MSTSQVIDIPAVIPTEIVEHVVVEKQCECGQRTRGLLPYKVSSAPTSYGPNLACVVGYLNTVQHIPVARCAELISDMTGLTPSTGWIDTVLTRLAGALGDTMTSLRLHLLSCDVVHFDETSVRVAGKERYVHSACSECVTLLNPGPGRDITGMTAGGVVENFTGVAVHDEYQPYWGFEQIAAHGICLAHRLRDLKAATERGDVWAPAMTLFLYDTKRQVDEAKTAGLTELSGEVIEDLRARYRRIVQEGEVEHPQKLSPKTGGRCAQSDSRNLLVRFRDREGACQINCV